MLSRKSKSVVAFLFVVLIAAGLSGCIQIQIVDRTPASTEGTPFAQEQRPGEHNLAVLAVDFDPPLVYEEIMARRDRGEGITLLVAVENTGTVAEDDVVVEVELSKDKGKTLFLHKQALIDAVVPGEIKLVHFKDTEIPFSYEYQLRVRVKPVAGETRVIDNEKSYDLLMTHP